MSGQRLPLKMQARKNNNTCMICKEHVVSESTHGYGHVVTLSSLQVSYISFSAHTDYKQTSGFIRALKPPHVILVHGEANEMNRLKVRLTSHEENVRPFSLTC